MSGSSSSAESNAAKEANPPFFGFGRDLAGLASLRSSFLLSLHKRVEDMKKVVFVCRTFC